MISKNKQSKMIQENILGDNTSIQLLQEYLYSEFLDWNKEQYKISLMKSEKDALLNSIERDRKLFKKIEEAIEWFKIQFNQILESKY